MRVNRIKRDDPQFLKNIRKYRDIISFRTILIHGYNNIDDMVVWGIIQEDLDDLIDDIGRYLP